MAAAGEITGDADVPELRRLTQMMLALNVDGDLCEVFFASMKREEIYRTQYKSGQ